MIPHTARPRGRGAPVAAAPPWPLLSSTPFAAHAPPPPLHISSSSSGRRARASLAPSLPPPSLSAIQAANQIATRTRPFLAPGRSGLSFPLRLLLPPAQQEGAFSQSPTSCSPPVLLPILRPPTPAALLSGFRTQQHCFQVFRDPSLFGSPQHGGRSAQLVPASGRRPPPF